MKVFLDTSAFFAVLDIDDANHQKASEQWATLVASEDNALVTTNYVLVECLALIQHRLGQDAVRRFQEDMLGLINVHWIDPEAHRAAVSAFLAASRRKLSFVDCVSFDVMRYLGIRYAFAFDLHFSEQGFTCIP